MDYLTTNYLIVGNDVYMTLAVTTLYFSCELKQAKFAHSPRLAVGPHLNRRTVGLSSNACSQQFYFFNFDKNL